MAEKIAGSTVATSETASPDILFKMYESITKPFLLARLKDPRYKEDIIFSREKFDGDLQESFSEYSGENGALLDVFLHINRYDGLIEETSLNLSIGSELIGHYFFFISGQDTSVIVEKNGKKYENNYEAFNQFSNDMNRFFPSLKDES